MEMLPFWLLDGTELWVWKGNAAAVAGIQSAGGSNSGAEEPLQAKSAASQNVQATQNTAPSKAAVRSSGADRPSAAPLADETEQQADQPAAANAGSKLFVNAGHAVVSVVADDADSDEEEEGGRQQTLSTTPFDELD